jgi:hypothetical protein
MLGYFDPYGNPTEGSEGDGGGAYFSNIRVLELGPGITNQPVSKTIGAGTNVTFTVGAAGAGPYTNIWYFGTNAVYGDTNSTVGATADVDSFTIPSVTAANAGSYKVVISDASGSVTSSVVTLTVDSLPVITGPANQTVYYGASPVFTATYGSGTLPFTYGWLSNVTAIAGQTASTFTLTNVTLAENGVTYTVKATNAIGTTSGSAVLTVLQSPSPVITNLSKTGGNVVLQFNNSGDTVNASNQFNIQASTNFLIGQTNSVGWNTGGFTNLTTSDYTFTTNGTTNFTVTIPSNTIPYKYFRIQHK